MDLLVLVIALSMLFAYINGMHDAATTIATSVATRALTPTIAVLMAAGLNLLGALLGLEVAQTIITGILDPGTGEDALLILFAGVLGAICWDLWTWWRGVPASSSHALIGGLAGAGTAAAVQVHWGNIALLVVIPMIVVPLVALALSAALTLAVLWGWRNSSPRRTGTRFQHSQAISAAALALGHGLQDGQKAIGVMMLGLLTVGMPQGEVPWWVRACIAVSLAAGTLAGGWRIVRTLGRRLADLDAPRGFAAETVASTVLYVSAYGLGAPVSTTHSLTAAIVGAGVMSRPSSVRWRVAGEIVTAWLATPVVSGLFAAGFFLLARTLVT
ncbi:MAG: anion permease [Actinomycetales bacterium]